MVAQENKKKRGSSCPCPWRSVRIHQATSNLDIIDITMSSVDNGEEEDADTPSKPGSTRLSFIKDPSRIEASSLEEDFSTRRRTENSPCPTSMWFLSSGDCLLRATLKKKEEKKERRKKKRTEGCRKNRLACSCAQQHVPRILEKLDIPQSSASRMSSREIYKGLRASLLGASATM